MDEQEFRTRADAALDQLYRKLSAAAEEHGIEADFNSGALAIEFEDPPAKFVVTPNTPVRQIWISALSTSFKLDWSEVEEDFVYPKDSLTLKPLVAKLINEQLGEGSVVLD